VHVADLENVSGLPVIVVHQLSHAIAALRAAAASGCPIVLASAPEAGIYAGPGWFGALVAAGRETVPTARFLAVLDCGEGTGAALAAIRAGIEAIIFTGRPDVAARLADIAGQHGVRFATTRPVTALDLGDSFFSDEEHLRQACAEIMPGPVQP